MTTCRMLGNTEKNGYTMAHPGGTGRPCRARPGTEAMIATLSSYMKAVDEQSEAPDAVILELRVLVVGETMILRNASIAEARAILDDEKWWKTHTKWRGPPLRGSRKLANLWAVRTTSGQPMDPRCRAAGLFADTPKAIVRRKTRPVNESASKWEIHIMHGQVNAVAQAGANDLSAFIRALEHRSRDATEWERNFRPVEGGSVRWIDATRDHDRSPLNEAGVPHELLRWAAWLIEVQGAQTPPERVRRVVPRLRGQRPTEQELSDDATVSGTEDIMSITSASHGRDPRNDERQREETTSPTASVGDYEGASRYDEEIPGRTPGKDPEAEGESERSNNERVAQWAALDTLAKAALEQGRDAKVEDPADHWIGRHGPEVFALMRDAVALALAGRPAEETHGVDEEETTVAIAYRTIGEQLMPIPGQDNNRKWLIAHGGEVVAMIRKAIAAGVQRRLDEKFRIGREA